MRDTAAIRCVLEEFNLLRISHDQALRRLQVLEVPEEEAEDMLFQVENGCQPMQSTEARLRLMEGGL